MEKIKSEKDLIIVPKSYFDGIREMLQEFVNKIEIHDMDTMQKLLYLRDWLNASKVDKEARKMFPNLKWDNIHLLLQQENDTEIVLSEDSNQSIEPNKCYLIDEKFCEIAEKRLAKIIGMLASSKDSTSASDEIINELADVRNFFNRKDLRKYSNKTKDSTDMKRFLKPWMPTKF